MAIPAVIFQIGFAIAFLNCLLTCWTLCKLIHMLPGLGDKRKRQEHSIAASSLCFKWLMMKPCLWLRIHGLPELEAKWREIAKGGAPFIISNHNSKLDSLLITALLPISLGPRMRSLTKHSLFSAPLFGGICTAVGHFPVYFKGSKEGDFGVNKQAQAEVSASIDKFLKEDGGLFIFPEGQLNKSPATLQTFRRGSFTLPVTHKKPIWGFLNVGCETAWPYTSAIGGFPSDIYVRAFKVTDDASQFNNVTLAEHAGNVMQDNLDEMYNVTENKKVV